MGGGFGLHKGSYSLGCVTVSDTSCWDKLYEQITEISEATQSEEKMDECLRCSAGKDGYCCKGGINEDTVSRTVYDCNGGIKLYVLDKESPVYAVIANDTVCGQGQQDISTSNSPTNASTSQSHSNPTHVMCLFVWIWIVM